MELLKGYPSCVDFPAAPMTVELFKLNPEAKVILGIRYLLTKNNSSTYLSITRSNIICLNPGPIVKL